jgi:uncharacterized protein YkwD
MNHVRSKLLAFGFVVSLGAAAACSSPSGNVILIGADDAGSPVVDPPAVTATHDAGAGTAPTSVPPASTTMPPAPTMDSGTGTDPSTTPDASTTTPEAAPPTNTGGFDQFQERNLADINMYRATLNIAPLVLDQTLSTFALAGSTELSMDHSPHAHFIAASNSGAIWMSGFNTSAGENQGDPNGWTVLSTNPVTNELDQIDAIQTAMFDEGPGTGEAHGHYTNMMDATFTKVGVGLLEVDGALYLTNDFSN